MDAQPGDRTVALVMAVLSHRQHTHLLAWTVITLDGGVAVTRLEEVPAIVLATTGVGRLVIDLLPCALADIRDVQVAIGRIEAELPCVTEAVGPDLRTGVGMVVLRVLDAQLHP